MNNHERFKQLISACFDGEATAEEKQQLDEHLKACVSCKKYYQELSKLSSSLKEWDDEDPSPDLEQTIKQKVLQAKEGTTMKNKNQLLTAGITGSVVAAIFVLIVSSQMTERNQIARTISTGSLTSTERDNNVLLDKVRNREYGMKTHGIKDERKSTAKPAIVTAEVGAGSTVMENKTKQQATAEPRLMLAKREAPANDVALRKVPESVNLTQKTASSSSRTPQEADSLEAQGYSTLTYSEYSQGQIIADDYDFKRRYDLPGQIYEVRGTEQYDRVAENPFLNPVNDPLSTFSIDVDTASYSNVRRFLNNNQMPPADAVRIEEMVNYFVYDYPQPSGRDPFSVTTEVAPCPWNTGNYLALIGLQGKEMSGTETPPSNLVFLIDVSGSMNDSKKLPLLKQAFRLMIERLRSNERIAIVTYAGSAGLVLDSTPGYDKERILSAIDSLYPGGSTAGAEGIQLAYNIARRNYIQGGNNRIILATDGDFNVGISSDNELVRLIENERNRGVFLTVLGFGTGNYKDSKMEKLADHGNGTYHYIDNLKEARKVLVHELGSTLFTIAKDVKVQVEFNPRFVKSYRLVGYETRKLAAQDFRDDTKDAGEIGAGHTVTALYEIIPAHSEEEIEPIPLNYQDTRLKRSKDLMTVNLRYKEPAGIRSRLITHTVGSQVYYYKKATTANFKFASAVAEFGLLLKNSPYRAQASYHNVLNRANLATGHDNFGYRSEFIALVQKAQSLSSHWVDEGYVPTAPEIYPNKGQSTGGYHR